MHLECLFMTFTSGIQIKVFVVTGQLAIAQLNATDLNDAIAGVGCQTGGFGIQKNLTHGFQ
jgi:hypothetical protein